MMNKKGVTIIELAVVVSVFLIMALALTPFVNMTKSKARRINCANNLRQISLGLHTYAAEHNDAFPPALADLYPNYINNEKVFDCPATRSQGTKEKPDYRYSAGLAEASGPKEILVEDLEANHRKSGSNILRLNGSVEWTGGS